MKKNKSIDGLSPRRSKISPSTKPSVNPSAKKVAKSKSTTKRSAKHTAMSVKTSGTTNKSVTPVHLAEVTPISPKPSTSPDAPHQPKASVTEDFLSPTQVFDFDSTNGQLTASTADTINPSTQNSKKSKKPKKVKKPTSKKRKIIITIIVIISIILLAAIGFFIWVQNRFANMGIEGNWLEFISETYEPLKTDTNGRTNILAFGTSGYNMEGEEGNGIHDGAQLTDSIMVISLDQNTGDIAMLSLPRDLKSTPTCTATGKINEVYWCNNMDGTNEQAGAEALMSEVSDILGIDFQYYVHINWGSLVDIVNALGGITVTLDEGIYDYYYTEAVFELGVEYTIDGEQALGLARARHGTTSGDFSRGASQQKILIGIKDKILSSNLGISELLGLFNTLSDNIKVNFEPGEIKTLAHLLTDLDFNSIRQISLIDPEPLMTTGEIYGISYVLPSAGVGNYYAIQNYIAKMFSSDPRSYEDYSILILNATDTPGLASSEQLFLEDAGYNNTYVDDAPENTYTNGYTVYALTDTAPGTKKLLEEQYSTTAQPLDSLPAGISTDYDFIIIINTTSDSN